MRYFAQTLSLRSRDLTPTDYPAFSDKLPENAAIAMDGIGEEDSKQRLSKP
jgi:hypothetical protein